MCIEVVYLIPMLMHRSDACVLFVNCEMEQTENEMAKGLLFVLTQL